MNMKLLEGLGHSKLPTDVKNPFGAKNIESISVCFHKGYFHPYEWSAYGTVKFKNGNTEGEQKFSGESFDDVVVKIKRMLDTI